MPYSKMLARRARAIELAPEHNATRQNRVSQKMTTLPRSMWASVNLCFALVVLLTSESAAQVDFNTEVRPILSNHCLLCHGPDEDGVESGLQLHDRDLAITAADSGEKAIVPGSPDESELIARISADDEYIRMPPEDHGRPLSENEIAILKQWIAEGAKYDQHWAYSRPRKSTPPQTPQAFADWPRNEIDCFALQKIHQAGLKPSEMADRRALARRVAIDLTGLPLTFEETEAFVRNTAPSAYEDLVDDLLRRPSFGEHWARKWLDLARYADSGGYASDVPRTIWAYRDWVIRSYNDNMPFDQFTREQLAGDLLPNPTTDQLVATAFHRNTLTNTEGGTVDEEFRAAAIVDRVNTTMSVWMGTTIACAQCHTHKYDPITQNEYFQLYAIFNNTQDADRSDEAPTLPIFTEEQQVQRQKWQQRIDQLRQQLDKPSVELAVEQAAWEQELRKKVPWQNIVPSSASRTSGQPIELVGESIQVKGEPLESLPLNDTYVLDLPVEPQSQVAAIRLSTIPAEHLPNSGSGFGGGNFVITGLKAKWIPNEKKSPLARFVRIAQNGKQQFLALAEVQVFSSQENVAAHKPVSQSSTYQDATADRSVDGITDGNYKAKSVSHTKAENNPWLEVDLERSFSVDSIRLWNRTDNGLQKRLDNFTVTLFDEDHQQVWQYSSQNIPQPSVEIVTDNSESIEFGSAVADFAQDGFGAEEALTGKTDAQSGWAVGGSTKQPHRLIATLDEPFRANEPGVLQITIEQQSPHHRHLLGNFRLSLTDSPSASLRGSVPVEVLTIADKPAKERMDSEQARLAEYFRRDVAQSLGDVRKELKTTERQLAELTPATSVPILREVVNDRRETFVHHRGSYLDLGDRVEPGLPEVFLTSTSTDSEGTDRTAKTRLEVADWLVSRSNPLTARVLVNRYWESFFGRGIVLTSEEFGSQGELPSHPQLLDWLAVELMESGWDRKHLIKLIVMSATYQQSSLATESKLKADADNRWLSRGPRVRHTAEMVRDQAMFVSGLLSDKMFGPPVNPPQPDLGLKAAFGSSTDWKTSEGEDRYRRGIYTRWRRSNPYPSMATFDAPNREVCTVRRNSTNTPLQSLVTLNDPAFVEAAQALARLSLQYSSATAEQIEHAFQRCLQRQPSSTELDSLVKLYRDSLAELEQTPGDALDLATEPLGPLPDDVDPNSAAAMTVVCNILLNLDEMFLKR